MNWNFDKEFLLFDGAMGTALLESGMTTGELPELYNITKPELIESIHRSYVEAGSNVITTNTFQANRLKLEGCGYSVTEIVTEAVKLAKKSGAEYVALGLGPTGQLMEPTGMLSFDEAYELYKEQIVAGANAGADFILIETLSDIYEAKVAILAAKESTSLPIFCTLSFQEDGRTFVGCDPQTAVITLQSLGLSGIGVNCSLGPKELRPIVKEILRYSKIPVMVQPNAGLPKIIDGKTVYKITPDEFTEYINEMADMGVKIFGGCCGTTPLFISTMKKALSNKVPVKTEPIIVSAVTSGRKTVIIGNGVTLIGERINPTGKKLLKEALRNNDLDYIAGEAIDQVDAGADILDVNCGLPEIDEVQMLKEAVKEVNSVVNAPLQIDSSNPQALEAAARIYNGKPIINSANGEIQSMEAIFPIVKKYGALVVCLLLDKNGIPATAEGRIKIAEKIVETALSYGIPKEDILIDCLVLTASSNQKQVMETMAAIKSVKNELGIKTVLGVSNVSFGLPNRGLLNSAFLAAAFGAGLDAPILNPMSKEIMDIVNAFKVINGQDIDAESFIGKYTATVKKNNVTNSDKSLKEIIIEGRKNEAEAAVIKLMETMDSMSIVEEIFIPALDIVGVRYEKGEIFLPQLIRSAETVQNSFVVLKEKIGTDTNNSTVSKGTIVIATVKGDIHDIGKNIAKVLLENYGYNVIDLGKDVEIEDVVNATIKNDAKLVGLSALMTTTVQNMKETIKAIRKSGHECKIMVGGAVLNAEYAKLVGADFYSKDAKEGVEIAGKVYKNK